MLSPALLVTNVSHLIPAGVRYDSEIDILDIRIRDKSFLSGGKNVIVYCELCDED